MASCLGKVTGKRRQEASERNFYTACLCMRSRGSKTKQKETGPQRGRAKSRRQHRTEQRNKTIQPSGLAWDLRSCQAGLKPHSKHKGAHLAARPPGNPSLRVPRGPPRAGGGIRDTRVFPGRAALSRAAGFSCTQCTLRSFFMPAAGAFL